MMYDDRLANGEVVLFFVKRGGPTSHNLSIPTKTKGVLAFLSFVRK